jgi:hypothetical protein
VAVTNRPIELAKRATPPALAVRGKHHLYDFARNVSLMVLLWVAYAAARGLTADDYVIAASNAESIMNFQQRMGLPSEALFQEALQSQTWLIKLANYYYLIVHFPATIGFLVWTWYNHRAKFSRIRNSLISMTAIGLVLHVVYPLTPPRMMAGFIDTARVFGPDPYKLGISDGANQIAAMPSLHVAWALLVALGLIWTTSSSVRWFSLAHPLVTVGVVVLTANHYWVDAVVAALIVAAAWQLTQPTYRIPLFSNRD